MADENDNRLKAFAEVISIDAWHEQFSEDRQIADLHADVVFGTARVGGERESPVRFRLSLKRAELIIIIPDSEPIGVDRSTIARLGNAATFTRTTEQTTQTTRSLEGGGNASISGAGASGALSVKGRAEKSTSLNEKLEGKEEVLSIKVTHRFNNNDKTDGWRFESALEDASLDGRPWDAMQSPLLKLVDKRKGGSRKVEPSIRLEIRCLREDMKIEDIIIKDETLRGKLAGKVGFTNNLKAAEAYIRNKLEELGLEAGDLSDDFAKIKLAEVTAMNGRIA